MDRFSSWYVWEDREFPLLSHPGSFVRRIRWSFQEDMTVAEMTRQEPKIRETLLPLDLSLNEARNLFLAEVKKISQNLNKDTMVGFMTFSISDKDGDKSLEILARKERLGIRKPL